ncbi:MAG: hypothetical protein SWX82_27480 [Cyanobacteriota bacterium]|nr:hypothetical protein [Cyanobacteriota bacterium]
MTFYSTQKQHFATEYLWKENSHHQNTRKSSSCEALRERSSDRQICPPHQHIHNIYSCRSDVATALALPTLYSQTKEKSSFCGATKKRQGISPCILKKILVARPGFGHGYRDD